MDFIGGSRGVKAGDFIVSKRPRLGSITKHGKVEFADYERQLVSMQSTAQAIQQAYLGTRERAVVVLEGWDTAGKGGVVRGGPLILAASRFTLFPHPARVQARSDSRGIKGRGEEAAAVAEVRCRPGCSFARPPRVAAPGGDRPVAQQRRLARRPGRPGRASVAERA